MPSITTSWLRSGSDPGRSLELLSSLPTNCSDKPPILFIHGAFCSAHDFQFFLPYFASRGYPAYALSLRAHGNSWTPSWFQVQFFTTIEHHASDIKLALDFIRKEHNAVAVSPVVAGHSLGGGYLQYVLAREGRSLREKNGKICSPTSGLILLGSAPLSGGGRQIMTNWEQLETNGKGYDYPWSPRSQLETTEQVRRAFFHEAIGDDIIKNWKDTCRTKMEGVRAGLSVLWSFGDAKDVLAAIGGLGDNGDQRKVFFVAAELDRLVTPEMVTENAEAYAATLSTDSAIYSHDRVVMRTVIPGIAHHMMMDIAWEECATKIIQWIEG